MRLARLMGLRRAHFLHLVRKLGVPGVPTEPPGGVRVGKLLRCLALLLVLLALFAACAPRKGGVLNVIPQGNGKYEVTYVYTLTKEPPQGQVYVFWLVNVDEGRVVKMGTVRPGVNRMVKVQVDFDPTGAIVSPEPDANVERPGTEWELLDGRVAK